MRFLFCGGASCPEWFLAESALLTRLASVKAKLVTQYIIQGILGEDLAAKLFKMLESSGFIQTEINATISCITFIIENSTKYDVSEPTLTKELIDLGLPKENCEQISKTFKQFKDKLLEHYAGKIFKLGSLKSMRYGISKFIVSDNVVPQRQINGNKFIDVSFSCSSGQEAIRHYDYIISQGFEYYQFISMTELQKALAVLQENIKTKEDEKEKLANQLARLKNENSLRYEKIQWEREKVNKITRERDELTKMLVYDKTQEKEILTEVSQMDLLEYTNNCLTDINKKLDKYSNRSDDFNPFQVISIKPNIEGCQELTTKFRLKSDTTFKELKEMAFYWWNLNVLLAADESENENVLASLELSDEAFAHINEEDFVLAFFKQRGIQNTSQTTLLLSQINVHRKALNNLQSDSVKIQLVNIKDKKALEQFIAKKPRIQKIDKYKLFFAKFPGLRYYISELQIQKDEKAQDNDLQEGEKKKFELTDMNCLILSSLIVILSLTMTSYAYYLDTFVAQQQIIYLNQKINTYQGGAFDKVRTVNQFWDFLEFNLTAGLYDSESLQNPLLMNVEIIGGVQLRILRQETYPCGNYVQSFQSKSCFQWQYQNGQGLYDTLQLGNASISYQSLADLNNNFFMSGNLTSYKDGGYVVEFNRDYTYEQVKEAINYLRNYSFIDETTSVIIVHFVTYTPDYNSWTQGNLLLERNGFGQYIPYPVNLECFIPNMYYGSQGAKQMQIDLVRLVFASLVIAFIAYRAVRIYKSSPINKIVKTIQYLFLEIGVFNLGVSIFTIMHVITLIIQSRRAPDLVQIINSAEYVNLQELAQLYLLSKVYLSLTFMFVMLRLTYVLKLNDRISVIFLTYSKAFKELFAFLAIQFPIFISFTFMFQIIYADQFSQYTYFLRALQASISMIQGIFNIVQFSTTYPIVSIVLILLYYLFMLFFILSLFQAILIECYRIVIMKNGYPQEQDVSFTPGDLITWMFDWKALFIKSKEEKLAELAKKAGAEHEQQIKNEIEKEPFIKQKNEGTVQKN